MRYVSLMLAQYVLADLPLLLYISTLGYLALFWIMMLRRLLRLFYPAVIGITHARTRELCFFSLIPRSLQSGAVHELRRGSGPVHAARQ